MDAIDSDRIHRGIREAANGCCDDGGPWTHGLRSRTDSLPYEACMGENKQVPCRKPIRGARKARAMVMGWMERHLNMITQILANVVV